MQGRSGPAITPARDASEAHGGAPLPQMRLLGRNVRASGIGQAIDKLSGFLIIVVLARWLGEVEFGRFTVATAFVMILGVFVELGTNQYLVREGAQQPAALARVLGHVLFLRASLGTASILVAIPIAIGLGYDRTTLTAVVLFSAASALRIFANAFQAAFQALERLDDTVVLQIQQALLLTLATLAAVAAGGRLVAVSCAWAGVSLVFPLLGWLRFRRRFPGRIEIEPSGFRTSLKSAAPFSAAIIFSTTLGYLDAILVHAFQGNAETGLYGAAYRILMGLYVFPYIYNRAAMRAISYLARADPPRMEEVYRRATSHLMILALPCAAGGILLSSPIVTGLYGASYGEASAALSLLLATVVFTFPASVGVATAYGLGLEKRVAAVVGVAVIGNGLANAVAIPRWGIEGAAGVMLATEAFVFLAVTALLVARHVRIGLQQALVKPLGASLAMALVIVPLREAPILLTIGVGGCVYFGALLLLRAFGPEERALARGLVRSQ